MAFARSPFVTALALLGLGMLLLAQPTMASEPATSDVSPSSAPGEQVEVSWTGTIPPAVNATSSCAGAFETTADAHTVNLAIPAGLYDDADVQATFSLTFAGATDAILTVVAPDGTSDSSDSGGGGASESVLLSNPAAGSYRVLACAFLGTGPQSYTGTLVLATTASDGVAKVATCSAPRQSLKFTQDYIDRSRAGGEPIVATHPDGTLLWGSHAGTTHFYGPAAPDADTAAFLENYEGQTYQYYSTDGGASWAFVPRTPVSADAMSGLPNSGFSDPEFAIDKAGNVYISEINLANVAFSKSSDGGKTYTLQSLTGLTLSDRQWMEADEENVVYLTANTFGGGSGSEDPVTGDLAHKLFKSVDGAKTFTAGEVANPGGTNDIKVDKSDGTLYELSLAQGVLRMAAFRGIRGQMSDFAALREYGTIAEGVDTLSILSPSFDIDDQGNLYATWDESGQGARPAGIWFSSSSDRGRTWLPPVRLDTDDRTDIWPWLAVGDAGKVAVTWLQNDTAIPDHNAELAPPGSGWNVVVAQSLNGLGCTNGKAGRGPDKAPGFRITRASSEPVHAGTICQGGTVCQARAVDRRLGDYFANEIDADGNTYISVSDTRQGGSVALPLLIHQIGGPSFIGRSR
jgi:hypothetical protein